jgi:autotransporter-associated beta strand protein
LEFNFGAITPSTTLSPLTITGVAAFTATPTVSVIVSASSLAAGTYPLMTWSSTSGTAPTTANLIAALPAGTVGSLSVSGNTLNLVVVSYVAYWDNNGAAAGFGTASGIWASPTTGDATQGWSLDTTGGTLPADYTTTSTNLVNFGNGATGLGAGTITVSGVVTNGGMTFASGSGAVTLSGGTITLPAAGTITVNNTSDTISSALAGAGISLTKAGIGTLTLSGNNTYSGATTNSAGTLKAGSTTGLSANSAFSVAAGSTLDLGGYNNTIKSLGVDTATSIITNSTGSATLKVSTALGGTALPQVFTGSLGLQIFGGGLNTLLANANNTYSGGTILGIGSGTTLTRPGISGTIGTGSPGAVTKGNFGTGPITFGAAATDRSQFYMLGAATINNAIVVNTAQGDGSQLGAFRLEAGGGLLTIAGPVNANLADVVFEANNNLGMIGTVTGAISGSSGLQVLAQNNGGLIVTLASSANTNSYAGNTIITNSSANVNAYATLTLGAANQIPNGTGKGNLIVMGGSFKMGGFSETINGLSGSGIVDGVSGTPTLTVGDNDATGTTNTFSGVIKNTAGTLSLIKIGSGTLTLSGTNTYSGATAVSNGTLSVNGSLTNANITVAAGATLTGSGTIRCRVSVSTNDLITVSGTATLSNLTLALDVQGILPIGSYVLAKGLDAAQFKAVTGTPQNATKWSNVTYVNGQLVLVVSDKGTMISVF